MLETFEKFVEARVEVAEVVPHECVECISELIHEHVIDSRSSRKRAEAESCRRAKFAAVGSNTRLDKREARARSEQKKKKNRGSTEFANLTVSEGGVLADEFFTFFEAASLWLPCLELPHWRVFIVTLATGPSSWGPADGRQEQSLFFVASFFFCILECHVRGRLPYCTTYETPEK